MDRLVERCAGLDVHKDAVTATVRTPGPTPGERHQETQTFITTTKGLLVLLDWLQSHRVTRVGMESTGVYWKPVFYALEGDFECWLLNAQHLRNVPGRKTDVADSAWICQLVEHGLVRPSFVPPKPIRALRDLTRYRKSQIEERTREVQRLDKVLQDAGIKLTSVASETLGASARAMLDELISGNHDPKALADLAKGRLRAKLAQLEEALEGHFVPDHHGFMIGHILSHIDYIDETIEHLSARIEEVIAPFSEKVELLKTIPGVDQRTAEVIVAEIGADMNQFPSAAHLASWAGICPGNNESAGKHKAGRARNGSKWLRKSLTQAAKAGARTKDTYVRVRHARIRARRGPAKATGATRHHILVAAFHVLDKAVPYEELGVDHFEHRHSDEQRTKRLIRQLEQLGHKVMLEPAA
ncbi:MAG: IS110 family transposase [Actinomycetota bacterium]|nr:IS110 family transposase [Actinomycetota bacterium]